MKKTHSHRSVTEIHSRVETESGSSGLKEFLKESLLSLGPPVKEEEELLLGFQFGREERKEEKTLLFVFRCIFAFIHYMFIR